MQVFIIKKDDKTIYVGLNTDVTPKQYESLVTEAERNQKQADEEKRELNEKVANLEKAIKDLRHEIAVDRGEE